MIRSGAVAVISLKLSDELDQLLSEQAQRTHLSKSELMRRALQAYLRVANGSVSHSEPSAGDLLADLIGCCADAPPDLSTNPAHLAGFGER